MAGLSCEEWRAVAFRLSMLHSMRPEIKRVAAWLFFDHTWTGMRVAERRRLRSSVAPPTEIPGTNRGYTNNGDFCEPKRNDDFAQALRELLFQERRTRPPVRAGMQSFGGTAGGNSWDTP